MRFKEIEFAEIAAPIIGTNRKESTMDEIKTPSTSTNYVDLVKTEAVKALAGAVFALVLGVTLEPFKEKMRERREAKVAKTEPTN